MNAAIAAVPTGMTSRAAAMTTADIVPKAMEVVETAINGAKGLVKKEGANGHVLEHLWLQTQKVLGFTFNTLKGYDGTVNSKLWVDASNKGLKFDTEALTAAEKAAKDAIGTPKAAETAAALKKLTEQAAKISKITLRGTLPAGAKALTLAAVGIVAAFDIGFGMKHAFTGWTAARGQHADSQHEGFVLNGIASSLFLGGGLPIALAYAFKSCKAHPEFTQIVMKRGLPFCLAASAAGAALSYATHFANNETKLAQTSYWGEENPLMNAKNNFINPLYPFLEKGLELDRFVGIKRTPILGHARHSPITEIDPNGFVGKYIVGKGEEIATG